MNHRGAQFRDSLRDLFPARPPSRKESNHPLFALLVGGRSENTEAVFQALNCIAQYWGVGSFFATTLRRRLSTSSAHSASPHSRLALRNRFRKGSGAASSRLAEPRHSERSGRTSTLLNRNPIRAMPWAGP